MFFGKTTFAEDSFASQGIKDVSVSVTGQSLSTAIGNETAFSDVVVTPTGIAVSSTQASVTIFLPDVTATPTGIAVNWFSTIGPLTFSYAVPLSDSDTDVTEKFRFQIGTSF